MIIPIGIQAFEKYEYKIHADQTDYIYQLYLPAEIFKSTDPENDFLKLQTCL